jgi:hypothetical protein
VLDEYVEDGVAAVFVDQQVVVVSELATELLHLIPEGGAELEALADGLVETFGPPPAGGDGLAATRNVVKELAEQGLVDVVEEPRD